jgi:MoxR-like ATPase
VIGRVLICLLARGHLLLEDRPGLGKTTLAQALAEESTCAGMKPFAHWAENRGPAI